jgi:hypothetical protein
MDSGIGSWAPSAFICSVVDCKKTGKITISKVIARRHYNVHHREALGAVGTRLVEGVDFCTFCDQVVADNMEVHMRESHQTQYEAAWASVFTLIGPVQKRHGKTTAWEPSALSAPPAGMDSKGSSRGVEVGLAERIVKEAAVGGPVEEARRLARYMALTARGRERLPEVDRPVGFEGFSGGRDADPQSGTAWLKAAGMVVDDAVAARAVALCAPRPDDAAQDLLGRAVSRYMKEAGKLAGGGHGLPTAVMTRIKRNGLMREALTNVFRSLQNAESVGKYALRAMRVLNFARRAAEEDVTAILSGEALRTEGRELNRVLESGAADSDSRLAGCIHKVLKLCVLHPLELVDSDSAQPVWAATLSLCYRMNGGKVQAQPPHLVTSPLASLKYAIKCCAIIEIFNLVKVVENEPDERIARIEEVLRAVDEDDPPNSALLLLTSLSRVATAAATGSSEVVVTWCSRHGNGRECAVVGAAELSLSDLKIALKKSVQLATRALEMLLLEAEGSAVLAANRILHPGRLREAMEAVHDDARGHDVGQSWTRSTALAGAEVLILERVIEDSGKFAEYLGAEANETAYAKYMNTVQDLHKCIAFWAHTGTGGCPRGVELAKTQLRATGALQRGVFLSSPPGAEPQVYLAPQYDKRTCRVGNSVNCYRFFPPGIMSEVLFAYITYVKPFEAVLVAKHCGEAAAQVAGDFLFTDRGGAVRSGYALRRMVVGAVQEGTPGGVNMTYRDLRHWQKALLSEHLLDGDDATTQMLAKTFAHGIRIGGEVYGRTSDVTRTGTPASFAAFRTHCGRAHALFGVTGANGPGAARPLLLPPPPPPVQNGPQRDAPTPGSEVSATVASDLLRSTMRGISDKLDVLLDEGRKRPWRLGIGARFGGGAGGGGSSGPPEKRHRLVRDTMKVGGETEASRSALVTAELRAALQDSTATVRSPTVLRAILLVWEERHDFLLVSPTGSGKSMSYVIPARLTGGVYAVVVPTCALLANIVTECAKCGVQAVLSTEWDWADDDFAPGVVVFSLEALVSDAGRSLLVALGAMTRLRGIFFDEVHTMREWREFRVGCADPMPLLRNKNLLVPLVGLTATASPELCVELQQATGTWGTVLRAPTARPNLRYVVFEDGTKVAALARTVGLALEHVRSRPSERILIFCMTIAGCRDVSRGLEACRSAPPHMVYHGRLEAEAKSAADADFRAGRTRIGICTAGYGLGLDIPSVTETIHFGGARSVSAFVQESGRAGRSAATVCATSYVVVCEELVVGALADRSTMTSFGEGAAVTVDAASLPAAQRFGPSADEFLAICRRPGECFRLQIQLVVDGDELGAQVCCSIPGAALCYVCEREEATAAATVGSAVRCLPRAAVSSLPEQLPTPLRAPTAVTLRRQETDLEDGVAFTKLLEKVTAKLCGVCWVADGPGAELRRHENPWHCLHLRARCLDCHMVGCEATTDTSGRAGSGRKPCAEWMRLESKRGRCVACGIYKVGGLVVHTETEFGRKSACRSRVFLHACLAMWVQVGDAVRLEFPELQCLDAGDLREFGAKLYADGQQSVPLLVRMSLWWARRKPAVSVPLRAPWPSTARKLAF